ncbi:hlh transcription [Diplodia corticola]|uniref:Hlh transcription n=1 Tax=Diplodia corticola TaxID=236234 RepID=A0A1J9RDR7_9PEZI|nr:hlh transcription [Diplodia corticola]OJD38680.1 hlh transcription [Diplodia corticola]
MPRPSLPPTPAASTDIPGKPGLGVANDPSWVLPPAAMSDRSRGSVSSSSVASCNASESSYHPASPVPAKQAITSVSHSSSSSSKKRSANRAVSAEDDYTLPPPPTRLRKIIQMKPKEEKIVAQKQETQAIEGATMAGSTAKGKSAGGRGKKQNNGHTAAGRKIARKTAHSLIERRRRSKMNEEFGVLKDMIPACAGQEMHKLAILQASIEYMRYLERCVAGLKTANKGKLSSESPPWQQLTATPQWQPPTTVEDYEGSEDQDEDMSEAGSPNATTPNAQTAQPPNPGPPSSSTSPTMHPTDRSHFSAQVSPAIFPADGGHRRLSSLTASPNMFGIPPHHFSFSAHSTTTSPSILPSPSVVGQPESRSRHQSFALTSPALGPQPDSRDDHEATAALLMLNSDRRSWSGANSTASTPGSRGMSVKDLLSG